MSDHDPPDGQSFVLRVVENINDFTEDEWNSIAGTSRQEQNYNPFISRAFLAALEQSGCVSRKAGWLPRHLRLEDDQGNLIGAVPNYLKGHSQGEYVFDHGWADAFERAGGRYYPKFQAAVPFTPPPARASSIISPMTIMPCGSHSQADCANLPTRAACRPPM